MMFVVHTEHKAHLFPLLESLDRGSTVDEQMLSITSPIVVTSHVVVARGDMKPEYK